MSIEIIKKNIDDLFADLDKLLENRGLEEKEKSKADLDKVLAIFGKPEFKKNINLLYNSDYLDSFSFESIADLEAFFETTYRELSLLRSEMELEEFFNNGSKFDFKALQKIWKERRLKDKFPKFDFKKYQELTINPILEIPNYKGEVVVYDRFVVDKLILGIHQMLFSEMDLYMINSGKEGSGKSCFSSQLLLYIYTFLKTVGLIEYAYDIKQMFFSSVESVLEMQDEMKNKDYLRLVVLDEAYDLNRNNFKDNNTKEYKDDMRSARKNLRINILNLPQLGELDTSITLTRTNFIFYCNMDNDVKTGTLKKGIVEMYIFPRGDKIYSQEHKRNINEHEIQSAFSKMLEKKSDYYSGMPKEVMIKKFKFENVWGFDKDEYDEHIKNENKKKRVKDDIKLTLYIQYILYKHAPELKEWGLDLNKKSDMKMYKSIQKFLKKIENNFLLKPENLHKFKVIYENG